MYPSFRRLLKQLPMLADKEVAKGQLAAFYREWFDHIAAASPQDRPLRLYEDLSQAYVLGRRLPHMPKGILPSDGSTGVREPGKVAEQLMRIGL